MGLSAQLQSSHLLQGLRETYLAVTVTAPTGKTNRVRPQVNLAVVIDRSGSMAGEKLDHARRAAQKLIAQLLPTDRFSVIAYGSEVDVLSPSALATADNKRRAAAALEAMQDDGGTNLSGGLLAGRSQILTHRAEGGVSRLVLISDGIANEGIIFRDALANLAQETAQRGISITTVGVGLDFDEQVMTRIAVAGRGNYYFVESAAQLSTMFETELDNLGATTATNVRLAIVPDAGVEVLEVFGYPMTREAGELLIPVADLRSGEQRKVVLRLRVDASKLGGRLIAQIDARFRSTETRDVRTATAIVRTEVTRSQQMVRDGRDRHANRQIWRARTARAVDQASAAWASGRAEEARQILDDNKAAAAVVAKDLGDTELDGELTKATQSAKGYFKKAKGRRGSAAGKRAMKQNRADAYQLMK